MKRIIEKYFRFISLLQDLPPLFFRLILAYGFYQPAVQKLKNLSGTSDFFASLGIPFPYINAIMATGTENLGYILLFLGLGIRFITVPLMFVMLVAIYTVHWQHGFYCSKNGIEVPFYYFFMLLSLLISGAGRISLDYLITKSRRFNN